MTDNYLLYSNRKSNRHIFIRKEADGKETVIASDEVALYNENYPDVMDCHHGLVRMMCSLVECSENEIAHIEQMEDILRVPFDKIK
jgi:hypothetical protein